jgi:hypothetical protein
MHHFSSALAGQGRIAAANRFAVCYASLAPAGLVFIAAYHQDFTTTISTHHGNEFQRIAWLLVT